MLVNIYIVCINRGIILRWHCVFQSLSRSQDLDQKIIINLKVVDFIDLDLFDHEHQRYSGLTVDCWTVDFLFDHRQRSECTTLHDAYVNATPL